MSGQFIKYIFYNKFFKIFSRSFYVKIKPLLSLDDFRVISHTEYCSSQEDLKHLFK